MTEVILTRWHSVASGSSPVEIYPDGCRDVIWSHPQGSSPRWHVSALDLCTRSIQPCAGTAFVGFRLRPGVGIDLDRLLAALPTDPEEAGPAISAHCVLSPDIAAALAVCAETIGANVGEIVAQLGGSRRSVERRMQRLTGQGPGFWLRLARARKALAMVMALIPLAEVAAAHEYADQSHMTRDLMRWFGATPAVLRADPIRAQRIIASGYAS